MTYEETRVLQFLEESPETFYSRREIARKAVKRREFEENPQWASAAISALLEREEIEENLAGSIRWKKSSSHW